MSWRYSLCKMQVSPSTPTGLCFGDTRLICADKWDTYYGTPDWGMVVTEYQGKWVMCAGSDIARALWMGSERLQLQDSLINAHVWFSGGGWALYWDVGKWVLTELAAGTRVTSADDYYTAEDIPDEAGDEVTFTAAGGLAGEASKTITLKAMDWERWESATMLGAYAPAGGATGTRVVGTELEDGTWVAGAAKCAGYVTQLAVML